MSGFSSLGDLLARVAPAPAAPGAEAARHVPSGLPALDALTGGWRAGELAIVHGGPGCGKSALAYGFALHAARQRGPGVAILPLKHSLQTCVERLACALGGIRRAAVRRGLLAPAERAALHSAAAALEALPLYVHAAAEPELPVLAEQVRRLAAARGVGLVVVDGLSAIPASPVAAASALRDLAVETGAAVLATVSTPLLPRPAEMARWLVHLATEGDADHRLDLTHPTGDVVARLPVRLDRASLRFAPVPPVS